MAAMKSLLFCMVVGLAVSQVSAAVVTKEWRVPITLTDTVSVGDTVIWNWADTLPHDIEFLTSPTGFTGIATNGVVGLTAPPSAVRGPYNVTFSPTLPGTYTYHCTVHSTMTGTLTVLAAGAGNATIGAANVTSIVSNVTTTATNTSNPATAAQAAVTARTLGFASAAITQNLTVLQYLAPNFTAFASNVSGPLTVNNATAILGYVNTNLLLAASRNPLANVTSPVVKQFILIDPTNALITAQIPVLQHFATILWTYTNSTNATAPADWFAKTAIFTIAPISTA